MKTRKRRIVSSQLKAPKKEQSKDAADDDTVEEIMENGDDEKQEVCPICGETKTNLRFHMIVHRKPVVLLQRIASLDSSLKNTEKKSDPAEICKICGDKFWHKVNLNLHMKIHSKMSVPDRPKRRVVCKICRKAFKYRIYLHRHQMEHFKNPSGAPRNDDVTPVRSQVSSPRSKTKRNSPVKKSSGEEAKTKKNSSPKKISREEANVDAGSKTAKISPPKKTSIEEINGNEELSCEKGSEACESSKMDAEQKYESPKDSSKGQLSTSSPRRNGLLKTLKNNWRDTFSQKLLKKQSEKSERKNRPKKSPNSKLQKKKSVHVQHKNNSTAPPKKPLVRKLSFDSVSTLDAIECTPELNQPYDSGNDSDTRSAPESKEAEQGSEERSVFISILKRRVLRKKSKDDDSPSPSDSFNVQVHRCPDCFQAFTHKSHLLAHIQGQFGRRWKCNGELLSSIHTDVSEGKRGNDDRFRSKMFSYVRIPTAHDDV